MRRGKKSMLLRQHGSRATYVKGCRCEDCTKAHAEYQRLLNRLRRLRPVPDRVHGSENGYLNYGCRCESCSAAHPERMRDYNARVKLARQPFYPERSRMAKDIAEKSA